MSSFFINLQAGLTDQEKQEISSKMDGARREDRTDWKSGVDTSLFNLEHADHHRPAPRAAVDPKLPRAAPAPPPPEAGGAGPRPGALQRRRRLCEHGKQRGRCRGCRGEDGGEAMGGEASSGVEGG